MEVSAVYGNQLSLVYLCISPPPYSTMHPFTPTYKYNERIEMNTTLFLALKITSFFFRISNLKREIVCRIWIFL